MPRVVSHSVTVSSNLYIYSSEDKPTNDGVVEPVPYNEAALPSVKTDEAELNRTETPPPDTAVLAVAAFTKALAVASLIYKAASKVTVGVDRILKGNTILPDNALLTAPIQKIELPSFSEICQ